MINKAEWWTAIECRNILLTTITTTIFLLQQYLFNERCSNHTDGWFIEYFWPDHQSVDLPDLPPAPRTSSPPSSDTDSADVTYSPEFVTWRSIKRSRKEESTWYRGDPDFQVPSHSNMKLTVIKCNYFYYFYYFYYWVMIVMIVINMIIAICLFMLYIAENGALLIMTMRKKNQILKAKAQPGNRGKTEKDCLFCTMVLCHSRDCHYRRRL